MRGALAVALLLASCLLAPSARAQEAEDPALRRAARALAEEGIAAARERRWQDAREAFARSLALFPSAVTRMNLAGAEVRTGALVAAAEDYRRFLREADDEARARHGAAVEAALASLEPRIPTWTVRASLAEGDVLLLDGEPLREAALGVPLPIDPGPHEVAVRRAERVIAGARFDAAEGQHGTTELDVPPLDAGVEQAPVEQAPVEQAPVTEVTTQLPVAEAPPIDAVPPIESAPPGDDTALHVALVVGAGVLVVAAIALGVGFALAAQGSPAGPMGNVDPIVVF